MLGKISPAEERLAVRKTRMVPLMQSLYDWIQQQMGTLSRHSNTAKAFAYLLKRWDALNEYCRNRITCVKMPSVWWRWGAVTIFSSALMVVVTVRQ
ncbi:hypothetical protein GCM10022405_46860 [Gibbsiella dentisursi]|uniref:Transposase IS66 central domain-containing protein n=1 Tax=Gibbsiella dentisursi TaxID=796890 RepID=A0ABP7M6R5_9GAMM